MASLKEMKDCMNEWRTQDSKEVPQTSGLWCALSKKGMLDSFLGVGCFKLQLFPSFFRSQFFQLLGGHLRRFLFPNLFLSFFRKISGFSREKLWGLLNI